MGSAADRTLALPPVLGRHVDPFATLGADLFVAHVLPLLDAASLVRCAGVSRPWRAATACPALWRPLLAAMLAYRAHVPLPVLRSPAPLPPLLAFSIAMRDATQKTITPPEMCARIWEMRVKPICGPYWHALDPTSRGEDPLLRRFQCDHSVTAMQANDPIWGGQESVWTFLKERVGQRVQINRWPPHNVLHLPDGRWRLENAYASYTTCPDRENNKPSFLKGKVVEGCSRCNPKMAENKKDEDAS